ncbi:DUF2252 domain-containing protein [Spongiactinospora sp. TRM90649]|nr:DUF2252 domain-containing protein [Spongiactinospora sp. TRM90649]
MRRDPVAFRRKFRKMAASPFAFYRGSACLFYADMTEAFAARDFLDKQTSRVWIHGDLHAENFGTYMDASGVLVFNVNDFDEAYVGPYLWDLKRLVASLALIGYAKALSDDAITMLVRAFVSAYLAELNGIVRDGDETIGSLTLQSTTGVLHRVLQRARLSTRVALLDAETTIEDYDRRFAFIEGRRPVDLRTRQAVEAAFADYLGTLSPASGRQALEHTVKDVAVRTGVGIGSAGLPSYNLLLEGHTQALENDVLLYMKQAQTPAVARHIDDDRARSYFHHQGHRTAESQRALQSCADPWLGYTELNGIGHVVAEISPYNGDLNWDDIVEPAELTHVVTDLGTAVARMHSVADDASDHDLVDFSTEDAIVAVIGGDDEGFTAALIEFAHAYGARARDDHRLFVDLFRNGRLLP